MTGLETIVLLNTMVIVVNTFFIFINTNTLRKVMDQNADLY